ncbi:CBS domain-containing protein [Parathalassolituus penaei]|uniref:CBS domain-containing protein n=1 Tax=Parathalassolituus penaei TaxID=2997323 RepID=A0A9X3IUJ0_9GAMM|nr:CBS domain-containing protein [Parathalassolituus penaei]MCY0967415.1 CBS domain-containing protein [Parathalassolituus penaei]
MNRMRKLNLFTVSNVDELAWPETPRQMSMDTMALEFFTDFVMKEPLVIDKNLGAEHARAVMIKTHVRLKLVVNSDKQFVGIISAEDLSDEKITLAAMKRGVSRSDLEVKDLMTRKQDLLAMSIEEVEFSTIGDVINFLKDNHQQHCLVIDHDRHRIRGIFSASDISRKLRLPININDQSSFYKVFAAVS